MYLHVIGSLGMPVLFGFSVTNGTKYLYQGALESSTIVQFARSAAAGTTQPHLRSAPAVEHAHAGSVVELVGVSFTKVVMDPSRDVLVHFYSPACGHCRKLHPVLQVVAAELIKEEEVVVASCVAT